jgi:ABC-type antimicrobial peptide transport system permease subunit
VIRRARVHAVVTHEIRRRRHEIGVRIALGGPTREILRIVLAESATLILTGLALGSVLVLWVGKLLESLLSGVSPVHPPGLLLVATILVASGLVVAGPAREAVRTDVAAFSVTMPARNSPHV